MRWDELFADLEAQLEAGIGAEERESDAEEERLRLGRRSLRDRIAAMGEGRTPVRIRLLDGDVLELAPRTVGRDWIAGDIPGGAQAILPVAAVAALLPTSGQVAAGGGPPAGVLTDRLGLPFVLRDLARRRRPVQLRLRHGSTAGTIDRVGRDHLDLAVHALDDPRRHSAVVRIEVLSLAELLLVRVD